MIENNQRAEIQKRLDANAYFVNPHSDVHVANDMRTLLELLDEQDKKIESLQKKNELLSSHVLELTQEIENVKADFGNSR